MHKAASKKAASCSEVETSRQMPIAEPLRPLGNAQGVESSGLTYTLDFTLVGLPRTTNGSHGHWRAKAAQVKQWKQKTFAACWHKRPPKPLAQARITFTRASSVEPDYDNLVISFKPIMDGLRQAGILSDDKRANVGRPEYAWEKCKPAHGHIRVRVESVNQPTKEQK